MGLLLEELIERVERGDALPDVEAYIKQRVEDCAHRIDAPKLDADAKRRSDFEVEGVDWEHVAIETGVAVRRRV